MTKEPPDFGPWRAEARKLLLASRKSVSLAQRRRQDERMTDLLCVAFAPVRGLDLGFYWPMHGEFDPRAVVDHFREHGSRAALPVVIRKAAPMSFKQWWPGIEMPPGLFGLPVPERSRTLRPHAVLVPPVGFDAMGYRLGYGGGYFDRTFASLSPQPLKIGVAREVSRIDTIHPQPHDVPMDFVVTEAGVHEVTASGLRLVERLSDGARLAQRILDRLESARKHMHARSRSHRSQGT